MFCISVHFQVFETDSMLLFSSSFQAICPLSPSDSSLWAFGLGSFYLEPSARGTHNPSPTNFRALLKCHFFGEASLDPPYLNYKPTPPSAHSPHFPVSFSSTAFAPPDILCMPTTAEHCSVVPDSLQPHGLQPTRLLSPWDSSGWNTGVGCRFLLQGIFRTQGLNLSLLCLLKCRKMLYR